MLIYLVQSGDDLNGSNGYSYGLVHGGHHRLLVSFVDFMKKGKQTIHSDSQPNRRKLISRASDRKAKK